MARILVDSKNPLRARFGKRRILIGATMTKHLLGTPRRGHEQLLVQKIGRLKNASRKQLADAAEKTQKGEFPSQEAVIANGKYHKIELQAEEELWKLHSQRILRTSALAKREKSPAKKRKLRRILALLRNRKRKSEANIKYHEKMAQQAVTLALQLSRQV